MSLAAKSAVAVFRATKLVEIELSAAGLGDLAIGHYNHFRGPQLYGSIDVTSALMPILIVGVRADREARSEGEQGAAGMQ